MIKPEMLPVVLGVETLLNGWEAERKVHNQSFTDSDIECWVAGFIACWKKLSLLSDEDFADLIHVVGNDSQDFQLGVKWAMDLTKANDIRRQDTLEQARAGREILTEGD